MKNLLSLLFTLFLISSCSSNNETQVQLDVDNPIIGIWIAANNSYPFDSVMFTDREITLFSENTQTFNYFRDDQYIDLWPNTPITFEYRLDFDGLMLNQENNNFGWMLFYESED